MLHQQIIEKYYYNNSLLTIYILQLTRVDLFFIAIRGEDRLTADWAVDDPAKMPKKIIK